MSADYSTEGPWSQEGKYIKITNESYRASTPRTDIIKNIIEFS